MENGDNIKNQLSSMQSWLKVSQAAKYLGVTSKTLRNWDSSGKLKAHRHPINGYRLYRRDDLDKFLNDIAAAGKMPRTGESQSGGGNGYGGEGRTDGQSGGGNRSPEKDKRSNFSSAVEIVGTDEESLPENLPLTGSRGDLDLKKEKVS